jgi:hypothetical protein
VEFPERGIMISKQLGPVTVLCYHRDSRHFEPRTMSKLYVRLRIRRLFFEVEI